MDVGKLPDNGGFKVDVAMTLTAPGCGMGPAIAEDAKGKNHARARCGRRRRARRLGAAVDPVDDQRRRQNEARSDLTPVATSVSEWTC